MQITVPVRLEDAEVWIAVFGSGFETYPWWTKVQGAWEGEDFDPSFSAVVANRDPDDPEAPVYMRRVVPETLADGIALAIKNGHLDLGDPNDLDWDANDADIIMQYVVLGELVYG